MVRALRLSDQSAAGRGTGCWTSERNWCIHLACCAPFDMEIYFDSVVDRATTSCRLELQKVGPPANIVRIPVVE